MKFRAVHLSTDMEEEREKRSYADVSSLDTRGDEYKYGIEYSRLRCPIYTGELPKAREANDRPFVLTQRHYGCYRSHKLAIANLLTGVDALLVFECDAVFAIGLKEMHQKIERAWWACMEGGLDVFTFGPKHDGKTIDTVGDDVIVISQFIETHAYMIPIKSRTLFSEIFAKPWDALDYVYTIYLYDQAKKRIGTFKDRAVCVQADGTSLITGEVKNSETHHKYKIYG